MAQANNLIAEIDAAVAANKIMVYSKTTCPHCRATKELLSSKNYEANIVELDQLGNGAELQNALQQKTGQRTVPNIFINGEHIGGNSELQAANSNGSLA